MLWKDPLPPRKKHKRLTFNTARRDRHVRQDEDVRPDFSRDPQSQPRPATKRTLHHLVKFWQNVSDEYLEILEMEPESRWNTRVLKNR